MVIDVFVVSLRLLKNVFKRSSQVTAVTEFRLDDMELKFENIQRLKALLRKIKDIRLELT